jgi:CubicO group peptidase (beta-lactamase class C family)
MLLGGGKLDGVRILSRKSIELMTSDQLQGITGYDRKGSTFGLGFSVTTDVGATGQLGSVGSFGWGGAAGTRFWIDPHEELIGLFMVQILPHRTRMADEFQLLTYQSIDD